MTSRNSASRLEEEGVDTIGGLIFNRTGSIPRVGATLEIDEGLDPGAA